MRQQSKLGGLRLALSWTVDPLALRALCSLDVDMAVVQVLDHVFQLPEALMTAFPLAVHGVYFECLWRFRILELLLGRRQRTRFFR